VNELFERYRNLALVAGAPTRQKESLEWFRNRLRKDRIRDFDQVTENARTPFIKEGQMITYEYDPLMKKKLPYYDVYPLIVIAEIYLDGWLGINVHYLPPKFRSMLFYELNYKRTSMVQLSEKLKKHPISKPAFKRYKANNLRTKPKLIPKSEWDIAIQLPYEKFIGASNDKVWRDSRKKL